MPRSRLRRHLPRLVAACLLFFTVLTAVGSMVVDLDQAQRASGEEELVSAT